MGGQNDLSRFWRGNVDSNIISNDTMHRGDGKGRNIEESLTDGSIGEDAVDEMGSKWDHR